MAAKAIDAEIIKCLHFLGSAEEKTVLNVIKSFALLRKENTFQRISIEQYNDEIDEALAQVKAGEFLTTEELEKEMVQW